MTTASAIVIQAYREGNLIGLTASPTTEEATEGLTLLNDFIDSLFGYELGEYNFDWPVPPSVTASVNARFPLLPSFRELPTDVFPFPPGNVRVLMTLTADTTISLQQDPDDGARMRFINLDSSSTFSLTIEGNGRLVQSATSVTTLATALDGVELLYRADLGGWQTVIDLVSATESPLPQLYDRLLALGTYIYLAPRHGKELTATQDRSYRRLLKRLKTQYRQTVLQPSADPQPFFLPAADRDRRGFTDTNGSLFE